MRASRRRWAARLPVAALRRAAGAPGGEDGPGWRSSRIAGSGRRGSALSDPAGTDADATSRWLVADPGRLWDVAVVVDVAAETAESTTLGIQLPETPDLLPGQYYLVRLAVDVPPGRVEEAFSVSSSPYPPSPRIEITVREVPGGRASPLLARAVRVGDRLHVRGPYGFLTWTEQEVAPLALIGAGTGVAPLMSVVRYAAVRQALVPMMLLCSSRDRSRVLFRQPLARLASRAPWLSVVHTFTRSPDDGYARYHRRIDASMIEESIRALGPAGVNGTDFMVAGSAAMVAATREALAAIGVPDGNVASENHA